MDDCGQSTLEYALIVIAFLAMVSCLTLLWTAGSEGSFVSAAADSASHSQAQGLVSLLKDVVGY